MEKLIEDLQRSKELVELLEKHDQGISEQFLSMKMLILRFGLSGSFQLSESKVGQGLIASLLPQVVYQSLHRSVERFFQSEGVKELSEMQKDRVLKALEKAKERCLDRLNYLADPELILKPLSDGELIISPVSWPGHRVGTVEIQIGQDLLFMKANRGDGCGKLPGVCVYKAVNPFDQKALEILGYKCKQQDFNQEIDKHLGLNFMVYLPLPYQEAGDCPWKSHEATFLGALFGVLYQDRDPAHSSLDSIKDKALNLYEAWEIQDRTEALREHLTFFQSNSNPSQQDYFLLARMIIGFKGSPEVRDQARNILLKSPLDWDQKDGKGLSLLHYAAEKGDASFLEWCLENQLSLSLEIKDKQGRTPLNLSVEQRKLVFSSALVKVGASVENEDANGNSPLICSLLLNDFNHFSLLLNNQADFNRNGKFGTPLEVAIKLELRAADHQQQPGWMHPFIDVLLKRNAAITDPQLMIRLAQARASQSSGANAEF